MTKDHPNAEDGKTERQTKPSSPPEKNVKKTRNKSEATAKLKAEIKKKDKIIEDLSAEVKRYKDDYLRQLADKDNLRKRLEKEKSDYYQYALSESLKEILVVLDNFERALKTDDEEGESGSFRNGVEMIFRQLMDILVKQGVSPIVNEDNTFDPRFHQALATEESDDVKQPEISEVFQNGYMFRDRLLRPSLVKVVIPTKAKDQ